MTIYFAGNQITDFIANVNASEITTAGYFDSSWVSNAINHNNRGNPPLLSPVFGSLTEFWGHFEQRCGNQDANVPFYILYDDTGANKIRLMTSGNSATVYIQTWNGTAWVTQATSASAASINALHQVDCHVTIDGASSLVEIYINKVLAVAWTGTLSGNIGQIGHINTDNGAAYGFSQSIVADEPTLWFKYRLTLPTANSATNTAFTGDYTAVDEAILSDADFITSGTANQVETYTAAARAFTGYTVKAVILNYRALRDTTGPQNIQGALRIGGTNYFTANRSLTLAYSNFREYYPTNPATGIDWTPGGAGDATLEFGVKSIA